MIEHRHSRVRSHACVRLDPSSTAKGEIATRTRNSRRPRAPGSRNFQRAHQKNNDQSARRRRDDEECTRARVRDVDNQSRARGDGRLRMRARMATQVIIALSDASYSHRRRDGRSGARIWCRRRRTTSSSSSSSTSSSTSSSSSSSKSSSKSSSSSSFNDPSNHVSRDVLRHRAMVLE